jgi:magnesium chelatase subunit D
VQLTDERPPNPAWQDAQFALAALQVDPVRLGGIWLRAGHGPTRDVWLKLLQQFQVKPLKIPGKVDEDRLLGGIDLAQTLQHSRLVQQPGLLAQAHQGVVVLPMAERLQAQLVAQIVQTQDRGSVHARHTGASSPSQFSIIALDESDGDEAGMSSRLSERLGLWLDLRGVSLGDTTNSMDGLSVHEQRAAQVCLEKIVPTDAHIEAICQTAQALGIDSLRAPLMAMRLACVCAALDGRSEVVQDDLELAARLVLAPRATRMPSPQSDAEPEPEPPPPDTPDENEPPEKDADEPEPTPEDLQDILLAAAIASLPPKLLDRLMLGQAAARNSQGLGSSGQSTQSKLRGRPLAPRLGKPGSGARLHVLATLRSAAPKQRLRNNLPGSGKIFIRSEDFHIQRFDQRSPSCVVFALDASGSAAFQRLAEAKGAVELLLQQSYARRDSVCVIAFRSVQAQVLLPPTRSLVRAKRALAGLPGGGGTPLASGIQAALLQARQLQRAGTTPMLVILSDGRANVTLAGVGGRAQAQLDAKASADQWRLTGLPALWIDTSPQPEPLAQQLAAAMGASYFPMPYVQAERMAAVVQGLAAQRQSA